MLVYAVLLVLTLIVFVGLLFVLRTNHEQLRERAFYQYNFIPQSLISLVKIHKLKEL